MNDSLPESVLTSVAEVYGFEILRGLENLIWIPISSQTRMDEALHGLEIHRYGLCGALLIISTWRDMRTSRTFYNSNISRTDILELNSVIRSRSQVQLTFEYWSLHSGQQAPWKIWRHIDLHTFKKVQVIETVFFSQINNSGLQKTDTLLRHIFSTPF